MSARPMASLSSGLLARPGSAKPAMRPQAYGFDQSDDLGWNDMGSTPAPAAAPAPVVAAVPAPIPPVLVERAELTKQVAPNGKAAAVHKAAFTLRLDPDRHLRLRLASAVAGRSSQQLLVEALDALLNSRPQVEALARQVPTTNDTHRISGEKK